MRGVNRVTIIGNLGADPETRYSGAGKAICNLRIATSSQWTDKDGEKQEHTEWHSVVMFGKLAEIADEYCEKGRQIYIEGELRTEKWTDKDNIDRYTTKIYANEMQLLGSGGGDRSSRSDDRGERRQSSNQGGYGERNSNRQSSGKGGNGGSSAQDRARAARDAGAQDRPPAQGDAFDDDDIPF